MPLHKDGTLEIRTAPVFLPLLEHHRYKGAHGGRGSGKSHFFAESLMERCIIERTHAVCIREIQKDLRHSAKKLIEAKIQAHGLGHYFKIIDTEIRTKHNDSLIIFQGMQTHNAESIKSLEDFDICWVEEGQNLSAGSLTLLRPTIRKPGSELWFSWNPKKANDPVDDLFRGPNPFPRSIAVEVNYRDNPHFHETELQQEMEHDRARDSDKYQHIWLGGYLRNSDAQIFKNWRVEEFDTPEGVNFYFGIDWGFSIDPTVLVRCYLTDRTLYVDYELYKVGLEVIDTPEFFDRMGNGMARRWPATADNARPETISHCQKHGYPRIKPSIKGKGSVEDGVEFLKSYDIVVHPRCAHLIDELTLFSYKIDPKTEEIIPIIDESKAKHVNVIHALRYAIEGVRRGTYTLDNVA